MVPRLLDTLLFFIERFIKVNRTFTPTMNTVSLLDPIIVFSGVSPMITIFLLMFIPHSLYVPFAMDMVPSVFTVPIAFFIVALGPLVPLYVDDNPSHVSFPLLLT